MLLKGFAYKLYQLKRMESIKDVWIHSRRCERTSLYYSAKTTTIHNYTTWSEHDLPGELIVVPLVPLGLQWNSFFIVTSSDAYLPSSLKKSAAYYFNPLSPIGKEMCCNWCRVIIAWYWDKWIICRLFVMRENMFFSCSWSVRAQFGLLNIPIMPILIPYTLMHYFILTLN